MRVRVRVRVRVGVGVGFGVGPHLVAVVVDDVVALRWVPGGDTPLVPRRGRVGVGVRVGVRVGVGLGLGFG